jgi:chromosome segregation ATPase
MEAAIARTASVGGEIASRQSALDERERALEQQARQVAAEESELQQRSLELERLAGRLAERERDVERSRAALPERFAAGGGFDLASLERLVDAQRGHDPRQVEEWRAYLRSLREQAGPGGAIPSSFDDLVRDVFGPLLR